MISASPIETTRHHHLFFVLTLVSLMKECGIHESTYIDLTV